MISPFTLFGMQTLAAVTAENSTPLGQCIDKGKRVPSVRGKCPPSPSTAGYRTRPPYRATRRRQLFRPRLLCSLAFRLTCYRLLSDLFMSRFPATCCCLLSGNLTLLASSFIVVPKGLRSAARPLPLQYGLASSPEVVRYGTVGSCYAPADANAGGLSICGEALVANEVIASSPACSTLRDIGRPRRNPCP